MYPPLMNVCDFIKQCKAKSKAKEIFTKAQADSLYAQLSVCIAVLCQSY